MTIYNHSLNIYMSLTRNNKSLKSNYSKKNTTRKRFQHGGNVDHQTALKHLNTLTKFIENRNGGDIMDGGAKGNERQKQNTEVFKRFATKTINAIDSSVTNMSDSKEEIKVKDPETREFFSKITNLVRAKVFPNKSLIHSAIIQDINSAARRMYTEFMEVFIQFDADQDENAVAGKGMLYGDKSLTPEKVQKIKNRLRPAIEENVKEFMKDFVRTVEKRAKNEKKNMSDSDIASIQRVASKAILEYTNKFKQDPESFIKKAITDIKLSIMLHPSVSIDFHVYDNPFIIQKNLARFARKYFPNMINEYKQFGNELAKAPENAKIVEDDDDSNDVIRENNRLYAQFLRLMQDIRPLLEKRKNAPIGEGIEDSIGADGLPEPESFRESMLKGLRRITTATMIRTMQEIMKLVGDGDLPFTAGNVKKSLKTMQGKLETLKLSVQDPEAMGYLSEVADATREITEIITEELREPIIDGADRMMEIGVEAATKVMANMQKLSVNMIKIVPIVGDVYILAESSLNAMNTGAAAFAGFAGIAQQAQDTAKKIEDMVNDDNPNGIRNKFKNFKEFYNKFMDSLNADTPQEGIKQMIDVVADAIDPPDDEAEAKQQAINKDIAGTDVGDISPDAPPAPPEEPKKKPFMGMKVPENLQKAADAMPAMPNLPGSKPGTTTTTTTTTTTNTNTDTDSKDANTGFLSNLSGPGEKPKLPQPLIDETTEETKEEGGEEGDQEAKEEGDEEAKEEDGKEAKEEGGEEAKEEGGEEVKEQGSEEAKEEGGEEAKEQGSEETKEQGSEETKEQDGEETNQEIVEEPKKKSRFSFSRNK